MVTLLSSLIEVLAIGLLVLLNGVLSMSETAMVSARSAGLRTRAEEGDAGARAAMELASEPNRFLATVQIGITLVGVLAGALGGATLSQPLADLLSRLPGLSPYAVPVSFGVVVVVISYASLVLGELVPKRLALASPEPVASRVARPMRYLSKIGAPAVWFLGFSTDAVLRLFGARGAQGPRVTEREIGTMLVEGVEAGVLEGREGEIAGRALDLDDRPVSGVMTPRPDIVWLDANDPPETHWRIIAVSGHSAFPVGRGSLDDLLGLVSAKAALARSVEAGALVEVVSNIEVPRLVSEAAPASDLLEVFARSKTRMAVVIDERGNLEGLVTPDDVLKALVGEEPGAGTHEASVVERGEGSWLVDGSLAASELKTRLDLRALPGEPDPDYQTVGGMVLMGLGRVPDAGDRLETGEFVAEVVDMDGYRVDKVLVTLPGPWAQEPPPG